MMWNENQFEDRLIMMRDALAAQETPQPEAHIEKVTDEIFKPIEEDDDFEMDFNEVFAQKDRDAREIKSQE